MREKHLDMVGNAASNPVHQCSLGIVSEVNTVFVCQCLQASDSGLFVPRFQVKRLKIIDRRAETCLARYRLKTDAS